MTKRNLPALTLALACAAVAGAAYSQGGAKTPVACNVMTEKDAVAHVGAPLGSVNREESKSGHKHDTTCGYFPKGYDIRKADRPPERGVELQIYARRDKDDAKDLYEAAQSMSEDRTKSAKGGAKFVRLAGTGEAAFLETRKLEPQPGVVYEIALLRILKGSVMAQVTAWKKGAPADDIAKAAAKQVAATLP